VSDAEDTEFITYAGERNKVEAQFSKIAVRCGEKKYG
jgi:hypothetical protein